MNFFNRIKKAKIKNKISLMTSEQSNPTDPLGSYTGKPVEPEEKPTQDADDL